MSWSDWFEFLKVVGSMLALGWVLMLVAAWMLEREDKR